MNRRIRVFRSDRKEPRYDTLIASYQDTFLCAFIPGYMEQILAQQPSLDKPRGAQKRCSLFWAAQSLLAII